jgi:PAS domain S-box-containing protein
LRNALARRIRAEDALRAESNFRKAMEESMPTGMRAIDMRGRITYVNAAFCDMVGYPQEELIGAGAPFPYWSEKDLTEHGRALQHTLSGKAARGGIESRFRRRNGELFDVRVYEAPLVDSSGRQAGWMASIHDITEQRRARAELEASHQRFMTVLDGLDAAIYVADLEADEILLANKAFKSIYGYDTVGRNCWQVTSACHPDPARFMAEAKKLAPHQTPRELHETEQQNSLNGRWYQLRERAIQWVDGRVVRMEVATDITDRMNIEEVNNQQLERLQQTSRLITMGEMASSLAHELNQPLSAIANYNMGCVNRLQANDYRPEELLAAMQKASAQAERAGKIIRRVRDFVKKSEPQRGAVGIADVIEEVIGFAEIEARKAGVRISVSVPPELPAAYADKIMIEQVVLNLVKNGIEAMHDTPRTERELAISARANGQHFIEVKVADRGHGVLVEQTEKLFAPFYTTKPEGMGMGLNICRSIIEFHHGRLWAVANSGGGTVFSFTLPLNP